MQLRYQAESMFCCHLMLELATDSGEVLGSSGCDGLNGRA
jgi:hypothetical protein